MADIYTPKIKVDENGSVKDLNLNAYAVQGKVPSTETTANTLVARDNSGRTKISGNIDSPIQLMNVDLNTYNTIEKCGYYWCSSGSNVSNRPVADIACSFQIFRSATGDFHQVCYTDIEADARIYFRKYIAGKNWTEWILVATQKFVDDNYVSLAGGDTINGDLKVKGMVYANHFRELDTSKHYINLITGDNKDFGITGKKSTVYDLEKFYSKTETDDKFALKEDITGKINVSIDCDHEYEITGKTGHEYAVAVPDGPVVIKRINGQTRRKSLNLFNDYKEITINVGSEQWHHVDNATLKSWGLVVGRTYTLYMWNCPTNLVAQLPNNSYDRFDSNPYTLTFTDSTSYRIGHNSNLDAKTFTPMISILEGTHTLDTMPPFEPYDNTLVNSKCNLRSTGRNFYSSNDFYAEQDAVLSGTTITSGNSDYLGVLPKQKFVFLKGVTYRFRKLNATGTLPYGRIVAKGTPWSSSAAENGDAWYFDTDSTSFTALQNFELAYFRFVKKNSGDAYSFDLQITVENSEELIPYEESSMLVDKELGEFDYIDNVSHLLVKQTSNIITLDGSSDENWAVVDSQAGETSNLFRWARFTSEQVEGNAGVSNIFGEADDSIWGNDEKCFGITSGDRAVLIRVSKEECPDVNSFRTWLSNHSFQFVYKKTTPTTEPIQLEAGYQVWNSGLQIQETETLPYILEKEYAVSLYSQILAVTSIVNSIPDDVATKTWTDANYISTAQKGQADGVVPLNSEGKIDNTYLPPSEYVQKYAHHLTFKRIVEEDNQILVFITFTVVNPQKDKYQALTAIASISRALTMQGFNAQERVSLAQGVWREGNTNDYLSVFGVYGTLVAGTWKVNCVGITKNTADVTVYSLIWSDFSSDVVVPL